MLNFGPSPSGLMTYARCVVMVEGDPRNIGVAFGHDNAGTLTITCCLKMNKTDIRKITLADLEQLRSLAVQTFTEAFSSLNTEENMRQYLSEAFSSEKLMEELNSPGSEFYFATVNEEIAGYLKVNTGEVQTELAGQNGLEIERIYVLQKFQGQKIGQRLFEMALQVAKQQQCDYVWLGVWEENLKAIQFYRKNGFEVFDKHIFKLIVGLFVIRVINCFGALNTEMGPY